MPGVLLKFRATKDITEEIQVEVVPFLITIGLRSEGAQKVFEGLRLLSGNGAMKILGARLRPQKGKRQPLAKQVEEAYKATSHWEYRPRQLGSEIRITPHNACYFNASIQAFFWFGALAGNDGHLYGAAKAGVSILRHKRRIYFPDSIAWRFVFARWDNLCRRQDASEFLRRLVSRTSPAAYSGHGRRDCATLSMPLIQVCLAPHCCYILEETAVRL
eukprot:s3203_g8.t1